MKRVLNQESKGRPKLDKEFSVLYKKYKNKIYNYLYYLSKDKEEAEELSQDVFLKIYININKFQGKSSFKTWAFTIARNTYLTKVSRKFKELPTETEKINNIRDTNTPSQYMLNKERGEIIDEVFKRLPEKYKTIIILRDKEGMSYKEIADVMELSQSSVKVTLHRARNRFKEIYNRLGGKYDAL